MSDYVVMVGDPVLDPAGWWFEVRVERSLRYGPWTTERDARVARELVFQRWNRAARRQGGWMWKATHSRWHLTLPREVPVRAPRMSNTPCSVHAEAPAPVRG
ncbi:MAG: hypothetical protein H6734_17190 [Alphaproteobacteria bacterium]|nr:hypothetical protein [Alphaproteobacteria bacterium]